MRKNAERECANSFYKYGNEDILGIEQDELSHLWKIKFTTSEHYVVSREFDRSKGLYGNAPDDTVRVALMEFSDTLFGKELSIFDVMDMFIDRCFDESVFDTYTTNAIWLSYDFLHYDEIEDILNTFGSRIVWMDGSEAEQLKSLTYKYTSASKGSLDFYFKQFLDMVANHNVQSVFTRGDGEMIKFMKDTRLKDIPLFKPKVNANSSVGFFELAKDR